MSTPKSYSEKLKDPRWLKRRFEVIQAAMWRCEDCNATVDSAEEFHVHHTAYLRGKEPWEYPIELLMCLCGRCHDRRQTREDAFRVALGKITRFLPWAQLEAEVWRILEAVSLRETQRIASAFLTTDESEAHA